MANNSILNVWNRTDASTRTAGFNWYEQARADCERLPVPIKTAVGVVAALSPGLAWDFNITQARDLIKAVQYRLDIPRVGVYGAANRNKAIAIARGAEPLSVLGGNKVRSFYRNILEPTDPDPITLDRHCFSVWMGHELNDSELKHWFRTDARYLAISAIYKRTAQTLGVRPNRLQAVVWLQWRQETNQ